MNEGIEPTPAKAPDAKRLFLLALSVWNDDEGIQLFRLRLVTAEPGKEKEEIEAYLEQFGAAAFTRFRFANDLQAFAALVNNDEEDVSPQDSTAFMLEVTPAVLVAINEADVEVRTIVKKLVARYQPKLCGEP